MKEIAEFLSRVQIFSNLGEDEREALTRILSMGTADSGEVLFEQGSTGNELFIVWSGSIGSSVLLANGETLEVATFEEGDFFGEMSIFDNAPRSATCYAKEATMLLRLPGDVFFQLMRNSPQTAIKIMYKMLTITSQRLENTSQFLSDMVQWGEEARKRAVTDQATGLFNRGFLDSALEEQYRKAQTQRQHFCLVMADLDHFNDINTTYGHEGGDKVIQAVVPVFRQHFRDSDILARYGGDEFTFVLPDTTAEAAAEICNRIRESVSALTLLSEMAGPIDRVTTSQGIACYPDHARDLAELREQADNALYRAKENGRNCAVIAGKESGPEE